MCKVRKQKSSVDYWEARVSVILAAVKLSFLLGTKQPSWELKATVFGDHISLRWPTWHLHVTPCCKKNNFRTLLLNCSIPNSIYVMIYWCFLLRKYFVKYLTGNGFWYKIGMVFDRLFTFQKLHFHMISITRFLLWICA